MDIVSIAPLDISEVEWLENISIPEEYRDHPMDYIEYLVSIGEKAYKTSLVTTPEDYLTDLDYRISLLELGLGGETVWPYIYCKKIIEKGNYDKEQILQKLDVFYLNNRLSDDEYKELINMAKGETL